MSLNKSLLMRRLLFLFLIACWLPTWAQVEQIVERLPLDSAGTKRVLAVDRYLTARYQNTSKYDTAYYARPSQSFMVRARMNVSGSEISTTGVRNGEPFNNHLVTNNRISTSFGLSYRGLSVSFSLTPDKLRGKDHSNELNLSSYNNRYGIDVAYVDSKEYFGWTDIGGQRHEFPSGIVETRLMNANAYYAFSHRRFSYPAALTQSYIQQRSAGSWLLALSLMGGQLEANASPELGNPAFTLHIANLGIGGGYGYNWVLPHRWMIHASALPTVVVASSSRLVTKDREERLGYSFPELILTGRVAFVHEFNDQHFASLTYVNYNTIHGTTETLRLSHTKWRLRVSYGFRF